jgi:3-phosphoshikimate 1-carboxyvinyltransferase
MNITIHPGRSLVGEVILPGDKSLSHRAALFAALAEGESCIENFQDSGVTRAMLNAVAELGV